MRPWLLGSVAFATLISACSIGGPTAAQRANAYYGPRPDDYQEIIKQYETTRLKDPFSAQYIWDSGPQKHYNYMAGQYGWRVCASHNAKNSFGAYTGFEKKYYLIRDGEVVWGSGPVALGANCGR